jgi:hypothetical protein
MSVLQPISNSNIANKNSTSTKKRSNTTNQKASNHGAQAPALPFASPKAKTSSLLSNTSDSSITVKKANSINIDIVTGQKIVKVYFDPTLAIDLDKAVHTEDWIDHSLYQQCTIVRHNVDEGIVSVKLASGHVVKMRDSHLSKVCDQDSAGVADILKLKEFSEMSLIHTLRVRYARDEIYTFVGPILISINPYKWFKDLYSEQTMIDYHSRTKVSYDNRLFACFIIFSMFAFSFILVLTFVFVLMRILPYTGQPGTAPLPAS